MAIIKKQRDTLKLWNFDETLQIREIQNVMGESVKVPKFHDKILSDNIRPNRRVAVLAKMREKCKR